MIEALEREREGHSHHHAHRDHQGVHRSRDDNPPDPAAPQRRQATAQATILTRDSETGAHARAAVRVVEIQGNMARFDILELETEPERPEGVNPLAAGQPAYLGLPCSFEPDPEPQGT